MRPHCHCGKIAGWWYAPIVYQKMDYHQYLSNHAYCEEHADTENWAEYQYIGFHKKDWRWLKRKKTEEYLSTRNERLSAPYWDVSHVKEDGIRWHLGRYGGIHCWNGCKTLEDVMEATKEYNFVEIKEGWYD